MGVLVSDAGHGAADALIAAFANRRQLAPITDADPGFDLARAYAVQARLTEARADRVVGMKTGFTNRRIWDEYGVHAPIHGPVFAGTWRAGPLAVADFLEPRIEPEIVLRLATSPEPDMDMPALMACVGAVARGFEIVDSPFPGWRFRAADTVAARALHAALVTGDFVSATPELLAGLAQVQATLLCDGAEMDRGHAETILGGGPMAALADLVRQRGADRLPAGWIVSTGTLTRALPVAAGQSWTTELTAVNLPPLTLAFV